MLSIGKSKDAGSYKVASRYDGLCVPEKVNTVEGLLVYAHHIEELPHPRAKCFNGVILLKRQAMVRKSTSV